MGNAVFNTTFASLSTTLAYGDGQLKFLTGTFTFSNDYGAGGEELDLTRYIPNLLGILLESKGGYFFEYDYTNKKVKAIVPGAQADHSHKFAGEPMALSVTKLADSEPSTGLLQNDAGTVKCTDDTSISLGTPVGTVGADGGVAAPVPAAEVADSVNLSLLGAIRWIAWGV